MPSTDATAEVTLLLEQWDRNYGSGTDLSSLLQQSTVSDAEQSLVDILTKLAEIVERETEAWYKMDPDPFDDRHPGRADPNCALGHVLKTLFKNDNIMNKLVSSYLVSREQTQKFKALHTVAARLLLDVMPGLETSVIFPGNEPLIRNLIDWAQGGNEPLRSYAVGLLAAAMEIQELAAIFKDSNAALVPLMLKHLQKLSEEMGRLNMEKEVQSRPFKGLGLQRDNSRDVSFEDNERSSMSKLDSDSPRKHSPAETNVNGSGVSVSDTKVNGCANHCADRVVVGSTEGGKGVLGTHGKRKKSRGSESEVCSSDDEANERKRSKKRMKKLNSAAISDETKPDRDDIAGVGSLEDKKNRFENDGRPAVEVDGRDLELSEVGNVAANVLLLRESPVDDVVAFTPGSLKRIESMNDCSSSRWLDLEPLVIGTYRIHPMSVEMQQRLILHYLQPMGEYQELLSHVFDLHIMDLLFFYIDLQKNKDVRLAFEALKYLAALLCHKRFAVEFIAAGGVQKLLQVHRPSVAATGVSMCLYYLAFFEDAMERVCMLNNDVLKDLVNCVLWLLECSHESGRVHAAMFFGLAFPFRVIVELFDSQDGLRKLYNMLSTLRILNLENNDNESLNEDELFTNRQAARHVCVALRRYVEAHLGMKADALRRATLRNEGASPSTGVAAYKAAKFPPDVVQENIDLLLDSPPASRCSWKPMMNFLRLGGVELLIKMLSVLMESVYTQGKVETLRSALDVLAIGCIVPRVLLRLCETVHNLNEMPVPAISVLLVLAGGEVAVDPEVQKAALNVIINAVCGPTAKVANGAAPRLPASGSTRRRISVAVSEEPLIKAWETVRSNNGIMILLNLLMIKVPVTEADSIRALACKALVGLSRCDTVKQIISKLALFNNGQLQQLMWEPVLQDKHHEHVKFCRYANQLIEQVSGKPQHASIDPSLNRIRRDIVAQTRIVYNSKELLQLIYDHLMKDGMSQTAATLQRESNERQNSLVQGFNASPITPRLPRRVLLDVGPASGSCGHSVASSACRSVAGQLMAPPVGGVVQQEAEALSGTTALDPIPTSTPSASRLTVRRNTNALSHQRVKQLNSMIGQRFQCGGTFQSPIMRRGSTIKPENTVSLHNIVTSYLQHQHSACKNPVVTCPPFSLLSPHQCPEPKNRNSAPANFSSRLFRRQIFPRYGGQDGVKCDRKYVYSRFRPIRSYRDAEDGSYTCCAFTVDETSLMLGTYAGELKFINVQTSEESGVYQCHMSPLTSVQPSRDGQFVLTSSAYNQPTSALWKINSTFDNLFSFEEDHVKFSNQLQDRIVGTKDWKAKVYDVSTGRCTILLYDADKASNYVHNRATFNPSDDLVLNDGVLYDVDSGKSIHKFDKFNANISGLFHPNGLEVIINSEVWDIRTYHLLHTVPALDQCEIRFNHAGNIIYGAIYHHDDDLTADDSQQKNSFSSSFRTFDGADYSNIATVDVKRNILDLCPDSSDCYLALIENQLSLEPLPDESLCRLYEVGRLKDEEDDQDEDDGQDDDDNDDDNDDDDDDDDDDESLPHSDQSFDEANISSNDEHNDAEISGSSNHNSPFHSDDGSEDVDDDDDDDDDYDDDMDNVLFELSDLSNL